LRVEQNLVKARPIGADVVEQLFNQVGFRQTGGEKGDGLLQIKIDLIGQIFRAGVTLGHVHEPAKVLRPVALKRRKGGIYESSVHSLAGA
jgi:hypothetical protein